MIYVDLGKLRLKVRQLDVDQNLFAALLPELTHDRDALFIEVIGAQLDFPVDLGNLGLDQPTHEVADLRGAVAVGAFHRHGGQGGPLERHELHGDLLVDDVIDQKHAEIGGAIPRGGAGLAALAGVLLAVSRLTVPNSVTGLVVQPALVDVRLVVADTVLKRLFQQAKVRTLILGGSQLQAGILGHRNGVTVDGTHMFPANLP